MPPGSPLPDLPAGILEVIFSHVPLDERLRVCALVCRPWAAAAAATEEADVRLSRQEQAEGLGAWLARPGSRVTRLHLTGWSVHGLHVRLPSRALAQLRELSANQIQLHAVPSEPGGGGGGGLGDAPPAAAAGQLTRLAFDRQSLSSLCGALHPLSALGGLRELQALGMVRRKQQERLELLLPFATQLTALHVTGRLPATVAAALSGLGQLRQLRLQEVHGSLAAWLPGLAPSLTQLLLERLSTQGGDGEVAGLGHLAALRELEIRDVHDLPPALLAGLSGLRRLVLAGGSTADGAAANLLAALAQLSQLEHLQLQGVLRQPAARAEQYAALSASSSLTQLRLSGCSLPPGAARHVFAMPGALPRLRVLDLQAKTLPLADWMDGGGGGGASGHAVGGLASLAAACPGLRELTLSCCLGAGAALAPLLQLSGLRRLSVVPIPAEEEACEDAESDDSDAASYRVVARTPGRPDGLVNALYLRSTAPAGAPPDVWCQLAARLGLP